MAEPNPYHLIRRFSRPEGLVARTLADVLIEMEQLSDALPSLDDPDIAEVLPGIDLTAIAPGRPRLVRAAEQVKAALGRIGSPACVYYPAGDGDAPFLVYEESDEEPGLIASQLGHRSLNDLAGCVSAYDYAPDGSPLPHTGGSTR